MHHINSNNHNDDNNNDTSGPVRWAGPGASSLYSVGVMGKVPGPGDEVEGEVVHH